MRVPGSKFHVPRCFPLTWVMGLGTQTGLQPKDSRSNLTFKTLDFALSSVFSQHQSSLKLPPSLKL